MSFFRVLPFETGPGAYNMAADEALLLAAQRGQASLRGYTWSEATVSLGYFQSAVSRLSAGLGALPFVRRPSGGATLVHHHELTYCLAVPAGAPHGAAQKWMPRMHRVIIRALERFGLAGKLRLVEGSGERHGDVLCFQQYTPGDVLCEGHKVVGSAQRKQRQALLQHGGILLAQSEFAPQLPGIRELTGVSPAAEEVMGAVIEEFEKETGWPRQVTYWNAQDQANIAGLIEERYGNRAWNEKR
ncbi:MAG: lipoate--protein ligase family protein [Gemmataceae bacterium]